MKSLDQIYKQIKNHPTNHWAESINYEPIYSVSTKSKIILISQAPGRVSQNKNKAWVDVSGNTLRDWLGVTKDEFYNLDNFAVLPIDFYYPGRGKSGDLPPRKDFAPLWHPQILEQLKNVQLIVLIGNYAQKYYLFGISKFSLTENVRSYANFLPRYFPIVYPSPLNLGWKKANPWFGTDVLPILKNTVRKIIDYS